MVRAGAGYNTIDVAAASRRGIYVSNCPGKNSVAVAELAFALILALDRRIADNVAALRQGQWNKAEFSKARGLLGRTLGLIGVGRIGREMIPRAKAFGMPVVAWSRSLTPEAAGELGIEYQASPIEVARAADIVSVHVAANPQTRGLIDANFFEAMRPGAYFINTSRAEVVDQVALSWAVRSNGVRAGLDVFANEPSGGTGEFADDIVKLPGVYGTHHIGASTDQAQEAIAAETVRIVRIFQETGKVPERGEHREGHARHVRAGGAAPGSSGRAGQRAGPDQRGPHQCAGDGEYRLRRRAGGGRAHQPGDSARARAAGSDPGGESECAGTQPASGWDRIAPLTGQRAHRLCDGAVSLTCGSSVVTLTSWSPDLLSGLARKVSRYCPFKRRLRSSR